MATRQAFELTERERRKRIFSEEFKSENPNKNGSKLNEKIKSILMDMLDFISSGIRVVHLLLRLINTGLKKDNYWLYLKCIFLQIEIKTKDKNHITNV